MPQSPTIFDLGELNSDADNSGNQYKLMKLTATGFTISAAVTDRVLPLQNKPKTGEAGKLRVLGTSLVVVDGSGTAIAIGDPLASNGSGVGVKNTTADRPTFGYALGAATAANVVIEVLMVGFGQPNRTPA